MDDNASLTSAPGRLGAQAARGTAAALSSQVLLTGIYAASSLALARLLSPEDFGVFAIAFAVIGVLEIAQHGGMIVPLVQTQSLQHSQMATLFWFCAAVGAVLTACGWLLAPLAGWIYADSRVTAAIAVLAIGFVATGLTTTEVALMRRRMQFARLAVLEIASVGGAAAIAIVAAWLGAGYWSLVYLQVFRQVLFSGMLLVIAGRVPSPRLRRAEIAPLVQFGRVMVAFEAVGFANAKIDNLIVGWFAGPIALGFYAKAFEILLLTTSQISLPIGNVAHATLSRVQDEAARYRESLARFVLLSTSFSVPLITFVATHAPLVVVVLFGEKWLPSASIFRVLAPGALAMTMSASVGWIFVSLGRANRQLPWALGTSAITVIAFVAGARWGAFGVAVALSATRVVLLIPTLVFTCHGSPVQWFTIVRAAVRSMAASAIAALISSGVAQLIPAGFWSLSLVTCVFAACYVACWIVQPGGIVLMRQQLAFARAGYRHA